jgi:hypothetical protein
MRGSLIGQQVIQIAFTDLLFCLFCLTFYVLYLTHAIPHSKAACSTMLTVRIFLEFSSAMTELYISIGLIFGSEGGRHPILLQGMWPCCYAIAGVLIWIVCDDIPPHVKPAHLCTGGFDQQYKYATVVLSSCGLALSLFLIASARQCRTRISSRKQTLARAFVFCFNFIISLAPKSLWEFYPLPQLDRFAVSLLELNGAFNALTFRYTFWEAADLNPTYRRESHEHIPTKDRIPFDSFSDI